jgi:hypothetical protein
MISWRCFDDADKKQQKISYNPTTRNLFFVVFFWNVSKHQKTQVEKKYQQKISFANRFRS